jgi:Tfp pilus assembly protein PilN
LLAPLHQKEQEVAAIDREISKRKEEIKKIESLRKEYDGLQEELNLAVSYRQTKPNIFQILKELTLILPKSVWLTRVRIYDTHVMIEGYASSAAGLLPKIEASPEFARVEFASPTLRESTMNMDRFVIRMTIEGMEKEEPKGKNVKKQ